MIKETFMMIKRKSTIEIAAIIKTIERKKIEEIENHNLVIIKIKIVRKAIIKMSPMTERKSIRKLDRIL